MTEQVPLTTVPLPVKLRVEDYLMLDDAGAFDGYGKTELIDGEVVYRNAQHRPHARIKSRLFRLLAEALDRTASGLEPIVEGSIAVPPHNVPEPDIVVTSEPDGNGLIPLASVRLIVEVADSTLQSDLTKKAAIYARHGVPEYWVVDVQGGIVHRLWSPGEDGFADTDRYLFGEPLAAATIAGLSVETAAL